MQLTILSHAFYRKDFASFGIQAEQHPTFHEAFGVPEDYTAIGCITVGYAGPDDRRSPSLKRGRRSVEEVVHRGRW